MKYWFSHGKKAWYMKHINDQFVKKANDLNYRSRAAFKLQQIERKYKVIGTKVLDLGCSPGSWCQMAKTINSQAIVVGVDLLETKPIKGVDLYQADARLYNFQTNLHQKYQYFHTILSDMAPNFSGNDFQTHAETIQLNKMCLYIAATLGQEKCNIVMKSLYGQLQNNFFMMLNVFYQQSYRFKPEASRSKSSELYYVCKGKKNISTQSINKLVTFDLNKVLTKNEIKSYFKIL